MALENENAAQIAIDTRLEPTGTQVVVLTGELDMSNVSMLEEAVDSITARRPERLVFDMSALRFMDSSGIAVLVGAATSVDSVSLRNPSDVVRRIVEVTGLSELLPTEP